ncbi:ribonucleotide reductase of class Ia (aerobic) [Agrobacterium phage Atu_ph04]|uniref:ribonucleoside-diphosphate reductase n=1 Tax=Agrobacterium phage Atu_ph04 TaxID=2024263 RepID=A0A223VZL2_9CAUD|nr:ribonucleoside diphosphate reductase small subunit [Agrobacterium phage Atu_ph04]ASV44600.2 ribonucleotide reductase of class Ia (aerobic) [Agrobacterium phage Atu_ph04]
MKKELVKLDRPKIFEECLARLPNHYPETEEFMIRLWNSHWTPQEFDFKTDYHDYHVSSTAIERVMITRNMAAIGQVEVNVKRFWALVGENLPHPAIFDVGYTLAQTEVVHNKAYEKLLETLGLRSIFEEILQEPVFERRVRYLKKHNQIYSSDKKAQHTYSLILFSLFVENVSLYSQFYVGSWFWKAKNMFRDTANQIQYTKNEESLHASFGIYLVNKIREEYPELFDEKLVNKVREEALEAFYAESAIIDWIVGDYQGIHYSEVNGKQVPVFLTAPVLKSYIQKRIDISLERIGFEPLFKDHALRDLDEAHFWMLEEELLNDRVDFFSTKSVNYTKNDKVYDPETTPVL